MTASFRNQSIPAWPRGWRAIFFFSVFAYFYLVLSVATPAEVHDSDATTARFCFILSSLSLVAFAFCPSVFSVKIYSLV